MSDERLQQAAPLLSIDGGAGISQSGRQRCLGEPPDAALSSQGIEWELVIVDDDSGNAIESVAAKLAKRLPVRLEVRRGRHRDLSLAVLRDVELAKPEWIVVMDADLPHPPERIGRLLGALEGDCEMALGSLDLPRRLIDGAWSSGRLLNSRVACAPTPLVVECSAPASGFCAAHRRAPPETTNAQARWLQGGPQSHRRGTVGLRSTQSTFRAAVPEAAR